MDLGDLVKSRKAVMGPCSKKVHGAWGRCIFHRGESQSASGGQVFEGDPSGISSNRCRLHGRWPRTPRSCFWISLCQNTWSY